MRGVKRISSLEICGVPIAKNAPVAKAARWEMQTATASLAIVFFCFLIVLFRVPIFKYGSLEYEPVPG